MVKVKEGLALYQENQRSHLEGHAAKAQKSLYGKCHERATGNRRREGHRIGEVVC